MRARAEWMNSAVDPVMEFLDDVGVAVPQGVILAGFEDSESEYPSDATVVRAIEDLEEHEFIQRHDRYRSYVELTEKGERWLAGDLNPSEIVE